MSGPQPCASEEVQHARMVELVGRYSRVAFEFTVYFRRLAPGA